MARKVELYFKNENDAESARSKLRTQKVSNILVEEIPDAHDSDTRVFLANNPSYTTGAGASNVNSGVAHPMAYTGGDLDDVGERKNQYDGPINFLLTYEVSEENHPDVLVAIRDLDFYYHQN